MLRNISRKKLLRVGSAMLPTFSVLLAGCGGGGGPVGPGGPGAGTLQVNLVDAPDPTISALNVTINRVEAHVVDPENLNDNEDSHWQTITTAPQSFNLLDLARNEAILGSTSLPAGHYTQIRLFPSAATVTDSTGTHNVTIPSGVQSGIKLNVNYDISPNQVTAILLDFNVSKSLIKTGNGQYRLQPVIPAVVKVLSGTVTGTVRDGANPLKGAEVKATYTAGGNYAIGTEVNTSTTLADGTFKVWALLPGTYTLTASFTDPATNTTRTATKTGVVVSANQNVDAGILTVQ